MSPLEAARRLIEGNYSDCVCREGEHEPDCPTPVLPKIVAALEAAQAVVDAYNPQRTWADVMLRLEAALKG